VIALRLATFRVNHALGAAAIVFALLAAWPWIVPPLPATRPPAASPPSAPAANLATLPPLASFSAIVERPLFVSSRRPPPGSGSTQGAAIENRYRLLGIVATGPRKKAFIADGARRIEIAEGDRLDGWNVTEIGQDRVRLASPSGEAALTLKLPVSADPPKSQ
jgi:hypothetical protein